VHSGAPGIADRVSAAAVSACPATGVTTRHSAWNTCSERDPAAGVHCSPSHLGSLSTIVAFRRRYCRGSAVEGELPELPDVHRAGHSGHQPGGRRDGSGGETTPLLSCRGTGRAPPDVVPNVLGRCSDNCVPGDWRHGVVGHNMTVSRICCPTGFEGKPLKGSSHPAFMT